MREPEEHGTTAPPAGVATRPNGDGAAPGAAAPNGADGGVREETSDGQKDSRATWVLVVCCVAQFMVILDLSIVNVALPSIQSSLDFNSIDLLWIVNAYAITFAGFLMVGGRAADRLGQRRV